MDRKTLRPQISACGPSVPYSTSALVLNKQSNTCLPIVQLRSAPLIFTSQEMPQASKQNLHSPKTKSPGTATGSCSATRRCLAIGWQAFQLWTNTSEVRRGTNRKNQCRHPSHAGIVDDAGSKNPRQEWEGGEMHDQFVQFA